jgi:replication fork protection complex subunit Tof1/Swi1
MSSADLADPVLNEAADLLQQQLIYNGEVLDIAFESLRAYKQGTQSLAYLDSSVHLAYALLKMLEKWGKTKGSDNMYVRKKSRKRRGAKGSYSISLRPPASLTVFCCVLLNRCRRGRWYP